MFSYRGVLWWAPFRAFKTSGSGQSSSQDDAALIEARTPDGRFLNPLDYCFWSAERCLVPEGYWTDIMSWTGADESRPLPVQTGGFRSTTHIVD